MKNVLLLALLLPASAGADYNFEFTKTHTETDTSHANLGGTGSLTLKPLTGSDKEDHDAAASRSAAAKKLAEDLYAEQVKSGSATATDTSTDRAKYYVGDSYNRNMWNEDIRKLEVNQSNVYRNLMEVDNKCILTAAQGRTDGICGTDPNRPDCVGSEKAFRYSMDCNPAIENCKEKIIFGYHPPEWLAFGSDYLLQMKECELYRQSNKAKAEARKRNEWVDEREETRDDFASANEMVKTNWAEGGTVAPLTRLSGVSAPTPAQSQTWEDFLSTVQDGAVHFGYENGEFLKRAIEGDSLAALVKESPAYSKFTPERKASFEPVFSDPATVVTVALERNGQKSLEQMEVDLSIASNTPQISMSPSLSTAKNIAVSGGGDGLPAGFNSEVAFVKSVGEPTFVNPSVPPPPSPAEEAAAAYARESATALQPSPATIKRRELASIERISPSALHPLHELTDYSAMRDATTEADGVSLFQRVHGTYRKRSKGMDVAEAR